MSEWKEYSIKDLGVVVTGKTPSSQFPAEFGTDMPFITPTDYKYYGKWADYADRGLSRDGIKKLQNKVLPPSSVLVTCIGSDMGKAVLNKVPVITNQQINAIVPNNEIVTSDFLYYKIVDSYETLRMYGQAGSAVPIVNKGDFEEIILEVPEDIAEQKSIAAILSSLDDKIDLLHRQNKTLEALAETLFRQWFIEAAPQPSPNLSQRERNKEAAEGWERTTIGKSLTTVLGGTPSTTVAEYWDGNIPWINSGEINKFRIFEPTRYITKLGLKNSNTKLLPKGTTVIAITGATLGQISLLEIDTCANQSVVGILPNEILPKEFVFFWTKHKLKEILLNETGGAQPHINKNDVNETELIIPPKMILKERMLFISDYLNKITKNVFQIRTLTRLRDTLLPKLMSGEVRVKR